MTTRGKLRARTTEMIFKLVSTFFDLPKPISLFATLNVVKNRTENFSSVTVSVPLLSDLFMRLKSILVPWQDLYFWPQGHVSKIGREYPARGVVLHHWSIIQNFACSSIKGMRPTILQVLILHNVLGLALVDNDGPHRGRTHMHWELVPNQKSNLSSKSSMSFYYFGQGSKSGIIVPKSLVLPLPCGGWRSIMNELETRVCSIELISCSSRGSKSIECFIEPNA